MSYIADFEKALEIGRPPNIRTTVSPFSSSDR